MSQLVLLLAAVTAAALVPSASQAQQRTWFGCGDQIVYESGVALGQSRLVEAGTGRTVWRTACQADGRRFEIRRTKVGCSWVPDPARGVARREEREVYRDAAGEEIEVKPCSLRDDAETVPLRLTVSGCRMRNDFESGVTMGESRAVFSPPEDGGGAAPRLAQACAERRDAPLVWKHRVETCSPPKESVVAGAPALSWTQVTVESDPPRVIRSCQPQGGGTLRTTTEGCAGAYVHDLASATSYGTRRWYQVTVSGEARESFAGWVTRCVQSPDEAYQHLTVNTGWRHDDAARTSLQLSDTVVDTPTGRIVLETGVARERARPYALEEDPAPRAAGAPVAIGCERWQAWRRIGLVTRGDGSRTEIDRGPLPATRVAACAP
ncbi:hypothetical protein [Azospirillum brasilense]|uniref:hypothetical protein n=1 Tax=Azospirillum brasilense TaxID=192 RepID=UPI001FFFAF1E|nr:hypothetical protein [Azospirillum brasilense]